MKINVEKCRKALQLLIDGKHSLHVPPEKDDADILISDALKELERLQKQFDLAVEALEYVKSFPYLDSNDDNRTIQRHCNNTLLEIKLPLKQTTKF